MTTDDLIKEQRLMRMTASWQRCSGQGLKRLAAAGTAWLERNHHAVNALNVFPVPDGDTGINMLLTMRNAWDEVATTAEDNAGAVAAMLAKGTLMGSRGNSGVILSQLWKGFAQALEGVDAFDAGQMAVAMRRASEFADNVRGMKPVEGTILTVARDGAKAAEVAAGESSDLRYILARTVEEMHESVKRTPDLLVRDGVHVLRDAGVVDAGGLGLAYILEGMLRYLNGEIVEMSGGQVGDAAHLEGGIDLSGLDFPYDVQFVLTGQGLDIDAISSEIASMGDSALVVGDADTLKVHVHVVNPGEPLDYAAELGTLSDVVVENMREQYQEFFLSGDGASPAGMAVQPPEIDAGDVAAIAVAPGAGLERVFYSLGAARVVSGGQTMNPSTEELIAAVEALPADRVVLLPNNKNILMAAEQAAGHVRDKQVRVVASRTIPQGISALLALDPQGDLETAVQAMTQALGEVETGEITTATRTARVGGVKVRKGQLIGLHDDDLRVAGDSMAEVMRSLLAEMGAAEKELVTLYYGDGVNASEAQALVVAMQEDYAGVEFEVVEGGQPYYHYILSAE